MSGTGIPSAVDSERSAATPSIFCNRFGLGAGTPRAGRGRGRVAIERNVAPLETTAVGELGTVAPGARCEDQAPQPGTTRRSHAKVRPPVGLETARETTTAGAAPSVPFARRSFTVAIAKTTSAEKSSEFTARIKPVDHVPAALAARGFELGDAILDVVSDLLVELVREDDDVD